MTHPRIPAATDSVDGAVRAVRDFPRAMWVDLLRRDQSERWRAGCGAAAETYFDQLPELRDEREDALVLICGEVHLRREAGAPISLVEYQHRFPDLAGDLATQFELDEALAGDSTLAADDERAGSEPTFALPGFEILREIGRGASSVVYLARQLSVDRLVAIKVSAASPDDAKRLGRQRQEAALLSRLQHPGVVQIYDVVEHDGTLCTVLEYVAGPTLAQSVEGKPLAPREAARIVLRLAHALHEVHEAGILHRDLKPSNVLIAQGGEPKLTDFGLAKLLSGDNRLTTDNCLVGTPCYMPPEQAAGHGRDAGRAGDVYSLGAILYELLTGRPPFLGVTVLDTLSLIRDREPVPPRSIQPKTPRDLETICLTCLAKEPLRRYRAAAALAADLDRFLSGVPIEARRPAWHERAWRWSRRNPLAAGLASGLLVAMTAGFGGVLWQWKNAEAARHAESIARGEADQRAEEISSNVQRLQRSLDLVDRGRTFRSWRRWENAAVSLDEAVRLRPELRTAWAERSRLYLELGLLELAVEDERQAFKWGEPSQAIEWWEFCTMLAYVGDGDAHRRATARMRQRFRGHSGQISIDVVRTSCLMPALDTDYQELIGRARQEARWMQDNPLYAFVLGLAHYRAARFNEAVDHCLDSLRLSNDWTGAPLNHLVLTMAYGRLGKPAAAAASSNDAARAEAGVIQRLYDDGSESWVHHKGAAAAWAMSPCDWLEFQVLSREARLQMNDQPASEDARWAAVRARTFASLGRYDNAIDEYDSAIALLAADSLLRMERHRVLAYAALSRRDFASAAREFAEASRLAPDDAGLWMYQAQAHLDAGNLDAYRGVCGEMLHRFAQTNDPWAAARVVHVCANRADSLSDMTKLLPLAEVAAEAYLGAIRLKGVASVRAGRYAQAIQCFEEAKPLHAPHPVDMCFKAIAYFHLGDLEQSRRCVQQARDWIDQANRERMPPTDWTTPAWWNWPWHERTDAQRLLAEAESLVNAR